MSAFQAPAGVERRPVTPGAFGTCKCGCPIYEHGRIHKDGNEVWVGCRRCDSCTSFRASDGSMWPSVRSNAELPDPPDLDRDSDHWIDGRVYLTGDEPPL